MFQSTLQHIRELAMNNEFWGLDTLFLVLVWLFIGYTYARKTYERYFELDVDGFDGYRLRDIILFPMMTFNYLLEGEEEIKAKIFSTKSWIYLPIMSICWPLKLISCAFWCFLIPGAQYHIIEIKIEAESGSNKEKSPWSFIG